MYSYWNCFFLSSTTTGNCSDIAPSSYRAVRRIECSQICSSRKKKKTAKSWFKKFYFSFFFHTERYHGNIVTGLLLWGNKKVGPIICYVTVKIHSSFKSTRILRYFQYLMASKNNIFPTPTRHIVNHLFPAFDLAILIYRERASKGEVIKVGKWEEEVGMVSEWESVAFINLQCLCN